jgi:hypothetical protein
MRNQEQLRAKVFKNHLTEERKKKEIKKCILSLLNQQKETFSSLKTNSE